MSHISRYIHNQTSFVRASGNGMGLRIRPQMLFARGRSSPRHEATSFCSSTSDGQMITCVFRNEVAHRADRKAFARTEQRR